MSKKQERKKRRARVAQSGAARSARLQGHTADANERYRSEYAVRGARSNRFMLVRYLSALIFFLNISWLTILFVARSWGIVVPLVGFAASGVALIECMVSVSRDHERLKYAEVFYPASAVMYVLAAVITLVAGKDLIFPFLSEGIYGVALCVFCIAVEAIVYRRLWKIRHHTDKRYARYAQVSADAAQSS